MPGLYSKFHDGFIERYLNTGESFILNKEKSFTFKTKANYIINCHATIKPLTTFQ